MTPTNMENEFDAPLVFVEFAPIDVAAELAARGGQPAPPDSAPAVRPVRVTDTTPNVDARERSARPIP